MSAAYGHTRAGPFRSMLRTPGQRREEREIRELAEERLAFFGERLMGYRWDQPAYSLSYANRRRLEIARATATNPRLLLLDEPEAGIDIGGEQTLYELLDRLVSHHRLTALICSHELDLVFRFADQVLCLNRRLQCTGPPAEVLTAEALARLYGPATALFRHRPGGDR
jgi:ABC-type branched-subunit amino acid transport system ATPase component